MVIVGKKQSRELIMQCYCCDRTDKTYAEGEDIEGTVAEMTFPGSYTQILCLYCGAELLHQLQSTDEFKAMLVADQAQKYLGHAARGGAYDNLDKYVLYGQTSHAQFMKLYGLSKSIANRLKTALSTKE